MLYGNEEEIPFSEVPEVLKENEENNDVDMTELNQKEEKTNQKMSPEQFRKLVGYVKGKVNHMKHMDKKLAKRRKKNKLSKANRKKNRKN